MHLESLVDLLRYRGDHDAERKAFTFLKNGEEEAGTLSFSALDAGARRIAARLHERAYSGQRIILAYPPGLEFVKAFFGCLYAGAVAVPVAMPRKGQNVATTLAILADCQAAAVLTDGDSHADLSARLAAAGSAVDVVNSQWMEADAASAWGYEPARANAGTLAFLQYTSGSTGSPKGVMVTHGNLLHNERMIEVAFEHSTRTVVVGWLPLFHDMGLIGNVLQPLYLGIHSILMAPASFTQLPVRWLRAISRYGATTSGAPNFAYDLCVQRIDVERMQDVDLRTWRVAFNGSEPVRASTIERFSEAFAPYGFDRRAFYPCYGLAEATLFVSGGVRAAAPIVRVVDADDLERGVVTERGGSAAGGNAKPIVGCGRGWLEQGVAVVNPDTLSECPEGQIGEVWITGPNVAAGYWGREALTAHTFLAYIAGTRRGPYLRTGDLGFIDQGELFLVGRLKDLIIVNGRNHYPEDLEATSADCHPAVQGSAGATFAIDIGGSEKIVLIKEVNREHVKKATVLEDARGAIQEAIARNHDIRLHDVVLVKPFSIPRTSSGKVRRHACKLMYLEGTMPALTSDAWGSHERRRAGQSV